MKNEQGITTIQFSQTLANFCPLGADWYESKLTVTVEKPITIPDYIEVQKDIAAIGGKQLIIEDVVAEVSGICERHFGKVEITVSSHVNARAHFPVIVQKVINKQ